MTYVHINKYSFINKMAYEFDDWIKVAESKDLILKESDFLKLEKDVEYYVVELDYIRFLYIEYGKKYRIIKNKIYKPEELYKHHKDTIIRTGSEEIQQDVLVYEVIHKPYHNKPYEAGLYAASPHGWLASGSGDGYSRWMLWENLKLMPNVYFK